eukprot:m.659522 g.659522  ORF g.659522 m.659522 type:complete len:396 (+) comp22724_c2_seq3:2070-3257(+)
MLTNMGTRVIVASALLLALARESVARESVREYVIDLDSPPETRYNEIIHDSANGFNTTVWKFYNEYFANDKVLTDLLYGIIDKRGQESSAEMHAEIQGLAQMSGLPFKFVHVVQLLYELQTLMVPVVNFTQLPLPKGYEALRRIPWRGPGCTGIIATNKADGTVSHARNLDFSPVDVMKNLVYVGIFKKNGNELFRAQLVAGYVGLITGMKHGSDGFTIERNTRYPDHVDGNEEMFHNLEGGRATNGWTLRKIMEEQTTYAAAVDAIKAAPFISTEYSIVSGVRKGIIISKDPDTVAYTQVLGEVNVDERADYIIITNFDFFNHDIREYFDPTGGQIGYPRRIAAQKVLNSTDVLTPEVLFETINHKGVIADTIFQAVMNVETGLWNVSIPDLSN